VQEKLVEHWLTNVNELSFQLPLCEALLALGYSVLHVSKHGRGEHGKDIIARDPQGALTTFQLKGGNIDLATWRNIRGEIEELVQLPVMLPGIDRNEPHAPFLVMNGELRGDAVPSIREYSDRWHAQGHGSLAVWQKTELLQKFIAAHGSYIPSSLTDFRSFVELYAADYSDRLPRRRFADFTFGLYPSEGTALQKKRALHSAILTGHYIVAQYETAQNHVAALEGWTILATLVMHAVERDGLAAEAYQPTLSLITTGFDRAAVSFLKEVVESGHFVSPRLTIAEDPEVRAARTTLVLGWSTALWHRARLQGTESDELRAVRKILLREIGNIAFLTEADWPYVVSIILFIEREASSTAAETWLHNWIEIVLRHNRGDKALGFPSPYWLQEKALAMRYGKLPPGDVESFRRHTYTVHSALDMLVRRLCRRAVGSYWKRVSKMTFCDFTPDQPSDWFRWRCKEGESRMALFPLSMSWAAWREAAATVRRTSIPRTLIDNPDWLLPFALVFPHRVNRSLSAVIDAAVGNRAALTG
jgi:hypothetical protein